MSPLFLFSSSASVFLMTKPYFPCQCSFSPPDQSIPPFVLPQEYPLSITLCFAVIWVRSRLWLSCSISPSFSPLSRLYAILPSLLFPSLSILYSLSIALLPIYSFNFCILPPGSDWYCPPFAFLLLLFPAELQLKCSFSPFFCSPLHIFPCLVRSCSLPFPFSHSLTLAFFFLSSLLHPCACLARGRFRFMVPSRLGCFDFCSLCLAMRYLISNSIVAFLSQWVHSLHLYNPIRVCIIQFARSINSPMCSSKISISTIFSTSRLSMVTSWYPRMRKNPLKFSSRKFNWTVFIPMKDLHLELVGILYDRDDSIYTLPPNLLISFLFLPFALL